MRRVDFLIKKIRKDTNNLTPNRFNDFDIGFFLCDSQRTIQTVAINANVRSGMFSKEAIVDLQTNVSEYDLPEDIFSISSINNIQIRHNDRNRWINAINLTESELNRGWGYIVRNNKINVNPYPTNYNQNQMRVVYVRKIYDIGPRYGTVTTLTPGTIGIVLNSIENVNDYFDYISIVDKDGKFRNEKLEIKSVTMNSPVDGEAAITIDPAANTTGIIVGDFVVGGERTTTQSELPDVCENLLVLMTERFIQYVDSSNDVKNASVLTQDEKTMIEDLFKNHTPDNPFPPILSTDYINL
jgi:hypothetical protein